VEEREEMIEGVEIQIAWQIRRLEQRLDLRSEVHAPADYSVVQRLDADAIARQQQGSRPLVPDRQTEHAAEPRDGIRSPLLIGVDDRFRVGGRVEAMSGRLELAPQLAEVVDLAVEDDPDRPILVVNRLMPGRQVDDAQTPHAERRLAVDEYAGVV